MLLIPEALVLKREGSLKKKFCTVVLHKIFNTILFSSIS